MFEFKTDGGQKTIIQADGNAIYLASGIKLAKVIVPDMASAFIIETEHQ
jgi:hypothetical protein